jgi:carboxy-cis,cis-muconate cyclase
LKCLGPIVILTSAALSSFFEKYVNIDKFVVRVVHFLESVSMSRKWALATGLLLLNSCFASLHHLFTSSFTTPNLYALEFDDEAKTLVEVANITAHSGHSWISFSYDKSSLYAGEPDGFASYLVDNSSGLTFTKNVKVKGNCGGAPADTGSPFVLAELRAPFSVVGITASNCAATIGVDPDGRMNNLQQTFAFNKGSTIRGMVLDPDSKYLYTADEKANGIWTHLINDKGTINQIGFTVSPVAKSAPKHLVFHPDGRYIYAVFSGINTVAVFAVNTSSTTAATPRLMYTGLSYSLIPPGKLQE